MKEATAHAASQAQQKLEKSGEDFASDHRDDLVTSTGYIPETIAGPHPVLELVSHIEGKNAKVRLWDDRIEWERPRGLSAGKLTAGVMTGGASLLVTGVKGGKDRYETVLLKHVTNVSSRKDGLMYYAVEVQTSTGAVANTITFRVSKDEAAQFRSAVLDAIRQLDAAANPTVVIQQPSSAAGTASASSASPDPSAQLQQLAALRDSGILTEAEFASKKAEILARM
ncbi:SHOCT domain-containing protein [Agromyces archimandritae]|nr:SHOCT domain-containing protein [Agromyces archimandritae]